VTRASARRRLALAAALIACGLVLGAAVVAFLTERGRNVTAQSLAPSEVTAFDPFAYDDADDEDLLRRGRDGLSHVLYEKSPGGVERSAARVERFGPAIEAAAERHEVVPDTLAALVFLESAGRDDVIAGPTPESAAGLGQILPGTAVDLLGMRVDLARSKRLTRSIERERRRAASALTQRRRRAAGARAARLVAERRRVDARFDPPRALDGAARYLAIGEQRFGAEDLAATSYHMGIGNLESVIADYVAPRPQLASTAATVAEYDLSYPRLFFDSSPLRNPRTFRRLARLGDDSRTYLFRLEAAREILRLHRDDPDELRRLARLHGAKASAEEVLRPRDEHEPYADADALRDAYDDGDLVSLPNDPARLGLRLDRRIGELAGRLDEEPELYRGARPEALATLLYIAKETRRIAGRGELRVTSGVRDLPYQRLLIAATPEATQRYSLHTTGYALDISREFRSRAQERALTHVLERLRALSVIDWVYEPGAIHLTVGPDGERYLPLYETLVAGRG
jgi:hypothetical protein